jgi:hypothetical protein
MVIAFQGRALIGNVEVSKSGNWTLIGTTINGPAHDTAAKGLTLTYLPGTTSPSGALTLNHVSVFHRGRAPERVDPELPQSTVRYIGNDRSLDGWYTVEPGPRGGYCWMGAQADLVIRLRQSGSYQLRIPEIRPLTPDIMPKLQLTLCGVPMSIKVTSKKDDPAVFQVTAHVRAPTDEVGPLPLRLSFPDDCVRSPMELSLNDDQRPLTIALRAIALSAIDT